MTLLLIAGYSLLLVGMNGVLALLSVACVDIPLMIARYYWLWLAIAGVLLLLTLSIF